MRRWLALWLLLAGGLAPLLVRMHQVVHVPVPMSVAAAVASGSSAAAHVEAAVHARPHSVGALFGQHAALDCQTLDQLAYGQAPLDIAIWQAFRWADASPQAASAHSVPARREWGVLARGPPQRLLLEGSERPSAEHLLV